MQAMNILSIEEKNTLATFKFVEHRVNIHNLLFKKADQNGLLVEVEDKGEPWASAEMFNFK